MKQSQPGLLTQAEYARRRGVNPSSISRLKARGVLVVRNGLVDAVASDTLLDGRAGAAEPEPEPAATQASRPAPIQPLNAYANARAADMNFRARLRKLELDAKEGRLIDAEAVRAALADAGRAVRDGILGVPDRLAPILAAESDQQRIHALLQTELKRELEGLTDAIAAI